MSSGIEFEQQTGDDRRNDPWNDLVRLAPNSTSYKVTMEPETGYRFRVRYDANVGHSEWTTCWPEESYLRAGQAGVSSPVYLRASNETATTVDLSWTLMRQIAEVQPSSVRVQRQAADKSWTTVATLAAAATSHTVTGLEPETKYYFRVQLVTDKGTATSSDVRTWTKLAAKPVTNLTASNETQTTIDLSWTLPEQTEGASPNSLSVQMLWGSTWGYVSGSPEGYSVYLPLDPDTTSYTVVNLVPGTTYFFRVRSNTDYPPPGAVAGGPSGYAHSEVVSATTEPQPIAATALRASPAPTSMGLSWALPAQSAGVTATGVEVQQQSGAVWSTVATLAAGTTSHTVTGLEPRTAYGFRIRVVTSIGDADSETLEARTQGTLPLKPVEGLAASNATETTADLSWSLPAQPSDVTVTGVEVQQRAAGESWWSTVVILAADATSHRLTRLTNGLSYDVRIRLVANHESADSEAISLAAPNPATDLAATAGATTVELTWTLPEQPAGVTVTGVEVQQGSGRTRATLTWTTVATLAADATAHTVTGLEPTHGYLFRVRIATAGRGASTPYVKARTQAIAIPATGLAASNVAATTIDLAWTLPEQPEGVTVTTVRVQERSLPGSILRELYIRDLPGDATSHTVTGLTPETDYSFRVWLFTTGGRVVTPEVIATTQAANPAIELAASNPTETTVDLAWTLPAQPEGVTVTGVEVEQQAADKSWTTAATLASDTTSHTVTGLTAGTSYTFRIRLATSNGNADSEPAEAQTAHTPLEVEMAGSVPASDDGALRAGTGAQGCRVDVEVRFLDADENAVAVDALAATDFTMTNGRAGTPVADVDGLRWTVPVRATTNERGLLRVRLPATARWRAAEQVFHSYGAGVCATAARGELAILRVEELSISPSFTSTTTSYTAETTDADAEVVAEAVYADATVTIAPVDADEDADGHQLALAEGETEVTVTVTPGDGSAAKTYTVTVTRETADSPVPAPVNLQAVGGDEQVTLTWTAPEYGGSITGYEFRFCRVTSPTQCPYDEWKSTESTTSHTVKYWYTEHGGRTYRFRLSNGRKYRFQVRALAGDAEGLSSVEVEATPVAAPAAPSAGVLTGFVLLDASDQSTVASLSDGADIDLGGRSGGSFAIRADVAQDATVGSVALSLSGAKTVSATENIAPYSLWGDHNDGNGGRALDGASLPAGTYTLAATAYAEARASGTVLGTLSVSFEVLAPAALSVADARAEEGIDATLDFAVTLDRETTATVTVDYATSDDTATAGEDYTATSGTLTFAAGETEKTVSVPVLDDGRDEGEETLTFTLSNPSGATIADGEAVGTIANSDPVQRMWLARFGRTVGSQVVDAVAERLGGPLSGSQVTLGGQRIGLSRPDDEAATAEAVTGLARALDGEPGRGPDPDDGFSGSGAWRGTGAWEHPGAGTLQRSMSGRELLLGSAFHLSSGGETGGAGFAAWGRVTSGGFDAEEVHAQGSVRMDGDVTTAILGADATWSRWLAGVAVSVSEGDGTYGYPGADDQGTLESSLTGVHPYARVLVNERVQAWGLLGFGSGEMTMRQAPNAHRDHAVVTRTDIEMRLGAVGARGALLEADETGGLDLALKADAFLVRMESAKAANTEATQADASRLRLSLQGSRSFALGEGVSLTPGLEVGLRHDGGDAETGTGVELGGRIAWADAASGLSMEASARTLIAHEDSGYEEWGASGSVRIDPGASGRGLSLTVAPALGAASSGMERLWSLRDAQELANDDEFEPEGRLDAEVGYGVPVFGALTGTPYAGLGLSESGRDVRLGWRLSPGGTALDFELGVEGAWAESTNDDAAPERAVLVRGALRW